MSLQKFKTLHTENREEIDKMAGKRKQTPKRKLAVKTSKQGNPSKQGPSKQTRVNEKTSSVSSQSSTTSAEEMTNVSRRKQKHPVRKHQYTDMIIYGKHFKLSMKILKEIRHMQTSTKLLLPRAPFARLVRELLGERAQDMRVQISTLEALQQATEMYMHQFFEDSNLCANHCKRVTLFVRDMQLIQRLRNNNATV